MAEQVVGSVVCHSTIGTSRPPTGQSSNSGSCHKKVGLVPIQAPCYPAGMTNADVLVVGGGAAGLMCAMTAANRGRDVIVLEGSNKVGKKILMSGGGRCNFTNLWC